MTIYDVAKKAGVSVTTVSRVLNNSNLVSEKTACKVKKIIDESGYIPNAIARRLSNKNSSTIGVMLPNIENPFFTRILMGINDVAYKNNLNILLYDTREDICRQHNMLDIIMEERLSGLVIIPISENDDESLDKLNWLREKNIPVVFVDRGITDAKYDRIFSNDFKGSFDATAALIEQGHRKIATIAGNPDSAPGKNRYLGYVEAMNKFSLKIYDDYVLYGNFLKEPSYECTKKLMSGSEPPTAIFCANNLTVYGALKYLNENDIKIGKDISIIGYDELDLPAYIGLPLSVVSVAVRQMGQEAINILLSRIKENKSFAQSFSTKEIIIDTHLILRGSEKIDIERL